MSLQDWL